MTRLTGRVAARLKVDGGVADVAIGLPDAVQVWVITVHSTGLG